MTATKATKTTPAATSRRPATKAGGHQTLSCALAAAQLEIANPPLDKVNPHFKSKYATLAGILTTVRAVLPKHGLSFTQATEMLQINGATTNSMSNIETPPLSMVLVTTLTHGPSKETVKATYPIAPTKFDPQGVGSALTYARRYALTALVGIAGEEDDDGNAGSKGEGPPNRSGAQQSRPTGKFRSRQPAPCVDAAADDCTGKDGNKVPTGHGWTKRNDNDTAWLTLCDPCARKRAAEAEGAEQAPANDDAGSQLPACAGCGSTDLTDGGSCNDCGTQA